MRFGLRVLALVAVCALAPAGAARAATIDFSSSFEASDPQPTWTNTAERASGVTGPKPTGIPGNVTDTVVGVTAETEGVTVAPPPTHGGVVGVAMSYLGTPYVWGGGAPGGFDCSGLVAYAYAQVGVSLPHSSYAQYSAGVAVSRDQLQPGDLVFFDGLGHVGIYIGGDQFVHAPHSGDVVKVSSLGESWYASTYVGARRL